MSNKKTYLTEEQLIEYHQKNQLERKKWNQIYSFVACKKTPEDLLDVLKDQKMIRERTGKTFKKMYNENIELCKENKDISEKSNKINNNHSMLLDIIEFYQKRNLWQRILNIHPKISKEI